jgi:hypothetical protein
MSNLINPMPRFGLNSEANTMFDYISSRDVPITALYQGKDGQWNLETVRQLILAGKTIETAKLNSNVPPKPTAVLQPKPATPAKPVVRQPGAPLPAAAAPAPAAAPVAAPKPAAPATGAKPAPTGPRKALSAQQIQALKFEPLVLAALGITPQQAKVTGLTSEQVHALGMNSARAAKLKLTPAQEAALS